MLPAMNWFNRYPDPTYPLLRLIVGLTFACHGGQSLSAQEYKDFGKDRLNNSPRHGEWVDIKSGNRTIKAFVVYPERKDKAPVVLVIHEIFGLTDWVRALCDQLAENGVIAMARGKRSLLYRNRRLKRTSMLRQITR